MEAAASTEPVPNTDETETEALLTLTEVAEKLGVHYMTVYRHVRTGKLPATKHDGEWRVRASDLTNQPAPVAGRPGSRDMSSRLPAFQARLIAADEPGAWAIMENCLAAGATPADLHHELIVPVLRNIGLQWRAGDLSIVEEHTATAVMQRLVSRLGPLMRTKGRSKGTIVIGAVEADTHSLAAAIVADLLRNDGYHVVDLGGNTPPESFAATITAVDQCKAVGLSASIALDAAIIRTIRAIKDARPGLPVLLGGPGVSGPEHAGRLGADGSATDSRLIVEAFESAMRASTPLRSADGDSV